MATGGRAARLDSLALLALVVAFASQVLPAAAADGKCKVCCTMPKYDNDGNPIPGQFEAPDCRVPDNQAVEFADPNDACKASCEAFTCTGKCSEKPFRFHSPSKKTTRITCCCQDKNKRLRRNLLQTGGDPEVCTGGAGDPHFQGPGGIYYDFHGEQEKTYCLMTDAHFHMNAHFIGQESDQTGFTGTWMDAFLFLYTSDGGAQHTVSVAIARDAAASNLTLAFDGETLDVPSPQPGEIGSVEAPRWTAPDGSSSVARLQPTDKKTGLAVEEGWERASIRIANRLEMIVQVGAHHFPDGLHLDFSIRSLNATSHMHGVFGQMFNEAKKEQFATALNQTGGVLGQNGEGIVDGHFRDYETSDLSSSDCHFSRFGPAGRTFQEQVGSLSATQRRRLFGTEGPILTAFDCSHTPSGAFRCQPMA